VTPGDTGSVGVSVGISGNPFDGKGISKILIDPFSSVASPLMYVAMGDGGLGRNEVQQVRPNVFNGNTFQLRFTGANSSGVIVTLTTAPIVFDNRTQIDPVTGLSHRQLTAQRIAAALNALENIGGIGGFVTVTPPPPGGGGFGGGGNNNRYRITFQGQLSQTNVQEMTEHSGTASGVPVARNFHDC
jgi:hypothetical protein